MKHNGVAIEIGNFYKEKTYEPIIFLDVSCRIASGKVVSWKRKKEKNSNVEVSILSEACGAIRPGRLTYILGPSGAGKTTLMKILAGRKSTGVRGSMYGSGKYAVLVNQHATLIDTLTAGETMQFAARLKLPNVQARERTQLIANITTQLGIFEKLTTRAGHMSGGERKRLTIACELLVDPTVMLLDEPTSGLDSVSSMSVARSLQTVARSGRTVACVIHQPSSQLFNTADDILLLANGRTLYCGALSDISNTISKAGFVCPQYYNMADYMLEIASGEHSGNISLLEIEAKNYAEEMKAVANNDLHDVNSKKDLPVETEALLKVRQPQLEGYQASILQQLGALLWRCWLGAIRDVHLTQIRLVAHLLVALLLGALYNGAGADAARIMSNTGCLFFFLLFIFFANAMPPIHTFPVEASVVLQEHLNKWYSLPTYCASKILVDLPVQLVCATVFMFPAWYLTSQPMECRMGYAWLICALLTILAQTFGLVVGAACDVKLGLFVIPAANIPMLMFSEFFIPYREMPTYLRPLASISYFRYSFDAFLETVYGFGRDRLPCRQVVCLFSKPDKYLDHLGLSRNFNGDIAALVIWIVLLQILLICILIYRVYKACR
ncbi:hypothetical protein ACJJTC_006738 [Scirpophaga incertulas]